MIGDKKPVLNLPGCPYNPVNLTATVVHFLTFGELPAMDDLHRPLFGYGARIHDNCERRGHFDRGEFVKAWGDEGHKKGWCLYKMGCKGPVTFHNCPSVRYNDGVSWPVKAGHGCIACASHRHRSDFMKSTPMHLEILEARIAPATFELINGVRMPLVGFGCAGLGGKGEEAVFNALKAGFRHMDTAQATEWYESARKKIQKFINRKNGKGEKA